MDEITLYRMQPSAKSFSLENTSSLISLILSKKISGFRTVPCGTHDSNDTNICIYRCYIPVAEEDG